MRALHILLLIPGVLLCALTPGCRTQTKPVPKLRPQLLELRMYEWGLSTGRVIVDMRTGQMQVFSLPQYIRAKLQDRELADLRDFVQTSGLHDFERADSDINERMPNLDECPPTLILVYNDKERAFSLPLRGTVRRDLKPERLQCYEEMEDICSRLRDLSESYYKPPYLKAISKESPEYKRFRKQRDGR